MERKILYNLVGTLNQRFLFDKLIRMKWTCLKSLLLIEEYMEFLRKFRRITPESLNGALFAIVQGNISVVQTRDYNDTYIVLVTAAKQLLNNSQENVESRHRPKTNKIKNDQLYDVTGLPCVDQIFTENMLKKLGPVRRCSALPKKSPWNLMEWGL
jgi:ERCC4-type nuclease